MRQWSAKKPSVKGRWTSAWLTIALGTGLSLVLIACGNKGPLRMPDASEFDTGLGAGKQNPSVTQSNDL